MENITTNVKIVGELPFQRFVNFFLWDIDVKAEYGCNVVEERYNPVTHKDVGFETGKETDTLKTVSGFVKFTYKGETGSVSYSYRNHLKFDKKDLFDNVKNETHRLNLFHTTNLTMDYSSISIMVMKKLTMFFAENIRHFEGYIDLRSDDKFWYQKPNKRQRMCLFSSVTIKTIKLYFVFAHCKSDTVKMIWTLELISISQPNTLHQIKLLKNLF